MISRTPQSNQIQMPQYIVSACLAGFACRFDGASRPCAQVVELYKSGAAIPVCPESLSGLPVPREPCEQCNGRVFSRDGKDVTEQFQKGAERALAKALRSGCTKAILKAHSPSCGVGEIYDGSFSRTLVSGNGIFAQLLINAGFEVQDEQSLVD